MSERASAGQRLRHISNLVAEKQAIVLEIGTASTKCGFANEASPRYIIPSTVKRNGKDVSVMLWEDTRDPDDIKEILIDFLLEIFYQKLLTKCVDRRVVVVESLMTPVQFRTALADVLFHHYSAASVVFCPSQVVALLPICQETALVVDCGNEETTTLAIFEGVPIVKSMRTVGLGGASIRSTLVEMMKDGGRASKGQESVEIQRIIADLSDSVVEDIVVRCCIAGKPSDPDTQAATLRYPVHDEALIHMSHRLRCEPVDPLFLGDDEDVSIPSMVLDTLLHCPVDTRKELGTNILLLGGTSQLPGFHHRLAQELKTLAAKPKYKTLQGAEMVRAKVLITLSIDGSPDKDAIKSDTDRIKDHICTKLEISPNLVDEFKVEEVGAGLQVEFKTSSDIETLASVRNTIVIGLGSYAVEKAIKTTEKYSTGIADCFAIHRPKFPGNIIGWVGGAIFGSLELLEERSVSREQYKNSKLPDWTHVLTVSSGAVAAAEKAAKEEAEKAAEAAKEGESQDSKSSSRKESVEA